MSRLSLGTLLLFVTLGLFFVATSSTVVDNAEVVVLSKFHQFERQFNKQYSSTAERFQRLAVFAANLERVEQMNAQHPTPVFGITKFMDLSPEEFKARYLNLVIPAELPQAPKWVNPNPGSHARLGDGWDWGINASVITPVKNQEQCGSCWAFSATESVESAWALAGNSLQVLAPQQIVDCDIGGVDQGCNGGYPYDAFNYVISTGGMEQESSYPYQGVQGQCQFDSSQVVAGITTWQWVSQGPATENTNMVDYITSNGPLSVCVDASQWQYYVGGVLQSCGSSIDHAVQATGFGTINGVPVWNVRNSWGTDWGVNGYIYLERGVNLCAISEIVTAASA